MQIPFFQVDAFTDKPFHGNPAGVFLLWDPTTGDGNGAGTYALTEEFCQKIALEKNLPAIAFLRRQSAQQGQDLADPRGGSAKVSFSLRWFTPSQELQLCGHGTLAATHILWERGLVPKKQPIDLSTPGGTLSATLGKNGWIELDLPAVNIEDATVPPDLAAVFGEAPLEFYKTGDRYLAVFGRASDVYEFRPDFERLRPYRLIITAPADADVCPSTGSGQVVDFVSRFFAGPFGLKEDSVTGSAHCVLTPYWTRRMGRSSLRAYQASERGGFLKVRMDGDRVGITGQAVTTFKGHFLC